MSEVPAPFEYRYDPHDDAHCASHTEWTLEDFPDVPDALRRDWTSVEDLVGAVEAYASANPAPWARGMLDELAACAQHRCTCAVEAWDGEEEYLDGWLAEIGEHPWALLRRGTPCGSVGGPLTVGELFKAVDMSGYGFDEVEVLWDGTTVTANFAGYPWGSSQVTATPLRGPHLEAYEAWMMLDGFDERIAGILVSLDPGVAAAVADLLGELAGDPHGVGPGDEEIETIVAVLAHLDPADAEARALAVGLMPSWDGSPAELAAAASALAGANR